MKKKVFILFFLCSLLIVTSCGKKETKQVKETKPEDALMYTFKIDDNEYRFRLLDGWIKYPDPDTSVAFLVGNKDIKSFMTAGFEPKDTTLEAYKDAFVKKIGGDTKDVVVSDKPFKTNELNAYAVSFTKKDDKDRTLTYRTHLIESNNYFINLATWTSEDNPSEKIVTQLDKMLDTFEQVN